MFKAIIQNVFKTHKILAVIGKLIDDKFLKQQKEIEDLKKRVSATNDFLFSLVDVLETSRKKNKGAVAAEVLYGIKKLISDFSKTAEETKSES